MTNRTRVDRVLGQPRSPALTAWSRSPLNRQDQATLCRQGACSGCRACPSSPEVVWSGSPMSSARRNAAAWLRRLRTEKGGGDRPCSFHPTRSWSAETIFDAAHRPCVRGQVCFRGGCVHLPFEGSGNAKVDRGATAWPTASGGIKTVQMPYPAKNSARVSATTSVALKRSASGRRSSARWALASSIVWGPAP